MHGIVGGTTSGIQQFGAQLVWLKALNEHIATVEKHESFSPFGIGRIAHGRMPIPWLRRVVLSMFPGPI
jgi:hypothetical protein